MRRFFLGKNEQPTPKGHALMCGGIAAIVVFVLAVDFFEAWWLEAIWGAVVAVLLALPLAAGVKALGWTQPLAKPNGSGGGRA